MRVLGIDPGSIKTGYGIVDLDRGKLSLVTAGTIEARAKAPIEERLLTIYTELERLLAEHRPATAAVEDVFFAKHANAALKLGHARGVALLAIARAGLSVEAYPPSLVKRSIVGKGQADKEQVSRIVGVILGLRERPGVDATDALAVAITHAQAMRTRELTLKKR
ncbi:MAG TPA: crossover junction endodeoxyribonuclease RuvC [Planctomycetota bacterium]|nr:crossover junction endodeoxyribonuclease RuvC [Myxococcales bacterium]HLU48261.1 crossover junction endodeoxyribonuclease RuvC [Planctomycetota bacterium]